MSAARSRLQLSVEVSPSAARLLGGTLEEYSRARREEADERLRAEGFAEATRGAAAALAQAVQALEEERVTLAERVAETAAALAVDIAQELLRKELAAGNYDLLAIVREALAATGSSSGATIIRLNPADAQTLAEVPFRAGTEIEPDPSVRRGDVQVRTDRGLLAREIDECVATIRDNLAEATRSC